MKPREIRGFIKAQVVEPGGTKVNICDREGGVSGTVWSGEKISFRGTARYNRGFVRVVNAVQAG